MPLMKIRGFTLVEMAIVLTITGLLLVGGMKLMSSSSDTARYKETQNQLAEIKEALTSYYIQYGRLPCPDTDMSGAELGIENPATPAATCSSQRGYLPHVTLGLGASGDAWGERFKYVVSSKFTGLVTSPPAICSDANPRDTTTDKVTVQDLQTTGQTIADFAAFALIATGKNGRQTNAGMTGAFTNDGGCSSLSTLEQENCDADSLLRYGQPRTDANTVVFDDMVVWGSDVQLINQFKKSGGCSLALLATPTTPPSSSEPTPPPSNSGGGCSSSRTSTDSSMLWLLLMSVLGIWFRSGPWT